MKGKKKKHILLTDIDNNVVDVLYVTNWDEQFSAHLSDARAIWEKSSEDIMDIICDYLRQWYDIRSIEDRYFCILYVPFLHP